MRPCHLLSAATLAAALASPPALASSPELPVDGVRMESPHPYRSLRGGPVWTDTLIRPWASGLSLYFQRLDLGPDDYLVVDNGEREWLYTAADGEAFWTQVFPGGALRLSIHAAPGSQAWGVYVDRYRVDNTPDPTMSIYRRNNLVSIADAPEEVYDIRGPVARVAMEGIGYCSGFLFGRDLLMTNNHCVDSQSVCERTTVQFNYESDVNGSPLPADEYACAELVEASQAFDYAVLRLEGTPGRDYGTYNLGTRTPRTEEQGIIVQHPGGGRKAAALPENCSLGAVTDGNAASSDFRHQCDTKDGSSGAPVLTADFDVIGLHHFGGASWFRGSANQAVRMDRILEVCDACP